MLEHYPDVLLLHCVWLLHQQVHQHRQDTISCCREDQENHTS